MKWVCKLFGHKLSYVYRGSKVVVVKGKSYTFRTMQLVCLRCGELVGEEIVC